MSKAGAQARSPHEGRSSASRRVAGSKSVESNLVAAFDRAKAIGGDVQFTVEVAPTGETVVGPISPSPALADAPRRPHDGKALPALDKSLAGARERGRARVAEILVGEDMLTADEMATLLGTTRMTVNAKRRKQQLLGLEGAKRGVRYPRWQIGEDGRPFGTLPALFELLGGSPWSVYRFLVQSHAELGGLTGREALERGRATQTIEAAESIASAAFS